MAFVKSETDIFYADTGCSKAKNMDYHGPCLECPFEECLELIDGIKYAYYRRDREILNLWAAGMDCQEIAKSFNLSVRTILRIVRSGMNNDDTY